MSLKKVHDEQPKDFKFSDENLKKAEEILKRYPKKIHWLFTTTTLKDWEKMHI